MVIFLESSNVTKWFKGNLYTMLHGSCRNLPSDLQDKVIGGYNSDFNYSLCYRSNWLNSYGTQSFNYTKYDNFCDLHYAECPDFQNSNNLLFLGIKQYENYTSDSTL